MTHFYKFILQNKCNINDISQFKYFYIYINTCKESGIWVPDTSGMGTRTGIGVPENILGRILDKHLDDLWVWIPGLFGSDIHGYPYSHP